MRMREDNNNNNNNNNNKLFGFVTIRIKKSLLKILIEIHKREYYRGEGDINTRKGIQ